MPVRLDRAARRSTAPWRSQRVRVEVRVGARGVLVGQVDVAVGDDRLGDQQVARLVAAVVGRQRTRRSRAWPRRRRRGPPRGRGRPQHALSAAQRPRDHHLLDLVGALADGEDLRVAVHAAHRVLLDVAVAAVDLDRLLGAAHREPAGLELRLRGGEREVLALRPSAAPPCRSAAAPPRSPSPCRRAWPGSPGTSRWAGRTPCAPWRRRAPGRARPGRGRRPSPRRRCARCRGCAGTA